MAYNLVRRKEDNVVEWFGHNFTWVDKDNGGEAATHFTIAEETAEMKLPEAGFEYSSRDKITMDDADVPDDKEAGAILNGSEGSYSWA
tara:strand:- start:11 stop:274 length:264 start_codon:yes stop_codon:yes gene_type:complete